ncbi:MAG: helix-turn-helix domain-containing protein [Verrucomicrobiota bacterium]
MNTNSNSNITISFTGQLTINRDVLIELFRECAPRECAVVGAKPVERVPPSTVSVKGKPERLAFTMRETAELLGVSYGTVHRLLQRQLLRSSLALRKKVIPKSEIERFLKETSDQV